MSMSTADLAALLADPSRLSELPASRIPVILSHLTALQAALTARLIIAQADAQPSTPPAAPADDDAIEWISVAQAAALTGRSVKWFYRHHNLPFVKRVSAKALTIDRRAMDRWIWRQKA
jgi:hypothetical protein